MMLTRLACAAGLLLALACPLQAAPAYSVKIVADSAPPKEIQEPIRKLLAEQCVQLIDARGNTLAELWFCKEVAVKATETQVKNGLTYREVPISTLVGAIRVPKTLFDYRKQKIKAGVYTLRLALQPMDGDHMGTAPYSEFCLVSPAEDDKKPDLLEAKSLHELSGKSTEGHPAALVLFPGKGAGAEAKLENKGMGHWVLLIQLNASTGTIKGKFDLGLTLVGASASV
ncbi:MAG: hypothetical protein U0840_17520 [Gemmataceae bacterium]